MASNQLTSKSTRPLVALIGFLDTKLEEHTLVYQRITALGCDVKVIDISIQVSYHSRLLVRRNLVH